MIPAYLAIGMALGLWMVLTPRLRHRWHSAARYECASPCLDCWVVALMCVPMWPLILLFTALENRQ